MSVKIWKQFFFASTILGMELSKPETNFLYLFCPIFLLCGYNKEKVIWKTNMNVYVTKNQYNFAFYII